ncbi:LuxR C-terminal-related transcriptional regulator [Agromyces sp. GXQ0307]|uniref:LuxR C-terminal-related transcriptional regulator n=1 Tax=Agromyces sp. GXQ0307 TaxID=3377835 RepID=UPI00383A2504
MGTPTTAELARSAVSDRRWGTASFLFAEAQRADEVLSEHDLEEWSTALFLRGERTPAVEVLTRAHDAYFARGDLEHAARTANTISIQLLEAGEVTASAGWMSRSTRLAERLDESSPVVATVALVPAAMAATFMGDLQEAIRRFEFIADVAERHVDEELAAHAAFGRGLSLLKLGRWADGFAELDHAMDAAASGRLAPTSVCLFSRAALDLAHAASDLDRAERWTREFAGWCDAQPELVAYTGQAQAYRGKLALQRGAWAEAEVAAERADRCRRDGDFTAMYVASYLAADLQRLRGALHAAETLYRKAGETGFDPQPGLALALLAGGDVGAAQAMIRAAVAAADAGEMLRLLPAVVRTELAANDVEAARRAGDELARRAGTPRPPLLAAVVDLAEAEVRHAEGRSSDALEALARAESGFSGVGAPDEVARCRLLRGRILRALDDPGFRAELAAARARFQEVAARLDVDVIDSLLGERTPQALTVRELEVLRLLATGLSNRGIAERLSLSEKTIARHLSNIYGKLGLSSRSAATAYAFRHDLA